MPSIQERIVDRAKVLILGAGTLAGDRIFRSRTEAITRDMSPAIVIRPNLETTERESHAVDRNQFELSVEILAREDTTTGEAWDQIADLVKVAVHKVLMEEDTAGNCMVRYRFTYLCNTGDLSSGPTIY